jgi:hypothetical protein
LIIAGGFYKAVPLCRFLKAAGYFSGRFYYEKN